VSLSLQQEVQARRNILDTIPLALCQRYREKSVPIGLNVDTIPVVPPNRITSAAYPNIRPSSGGGVCNLDP